MITEKEFLNAIKIVDQYRAQQKEIELKIRNQQEIEQQKREDECGDHYFLQIGNVYSDKMSCSFCGKEN